MTNVSLSLCTGLQSGFVTLPRLSRLDRQFQDEDIRRGSLPDSGGITLTRCDSFTSFTVDLGPSLMSEVLELINNPSCLHMAYHSWAGGQDREEEDGGEEEEEEEQSSVIEMSAESPAMSSTNPSMSSTTLGGNVNNRGRSCSSEWAEQEEDGRSLKTPDASMGSPQRVEPVMEAERFQRATDVLSRHYGGGPVTQGRSHHENTISPSFSRGSKAPYTFSEEEEEIKV